jgi:hypothetical protein
MTVQSLRLRLLLVGPLRLVLSVCWLGAARAAGATLVAFAAGAFITAVLASNDPRARLLGGGAEPEQLPAGAQVAPAWRHAVHAAFPSTVGVSVLAAVALSVRPELAALLAGVLAGLGLAALLAAHGMDGRLYLEPRRRLIFRK